MDEHHKVVIVGAGIAGLATAVALKRVGVESLVLERAHQLRAAGAEISLQPNAWRALEALGVAPKLDPLYQPFETGRVTNLTTGVTQDINFSTGSGKRDGPRGLHRKTLIEALAEELPPGTIRFSSKLSSIKTQVLKDSSTVTLLELEDGTVITAKVLIGCDGVHSVVAKWLGLTPPIDSGRGAVRALSVFPQGHDFKREIRMFIESGKRVGFIPLNDTDVYWFVIHDATDREGLLRGDPTAIQREVTENLAKNFPSEFLHVVHNTDLSTLSWAPLMYRPPWNVIIGPTHKGSVTVAGDAFHPMTPDLAQGGGSALEDAVVLARNIGRDLNPNGIEKYVKERRWRVAGFIVGAYLFGWVQQGGQSKLSAWVVKWFRDHVFYKFVIPKTMDAIQYDCGDLQRVTSDQNKQE